MSIAVREYTDAAQMIADAKARRAMFYSPQPEVQGKPAPRAIGTRVMAERHDYPRKPASIRDAIIIRDWLDTAEPAVVAPASYRQVISLVCALYGVTMPDLVGPSRSASVALPRMIAFWVMRNHIKMTLPDIGRRLGDRDHTTVMSGLRKIDRLLADGRHDLRMAIDSIIASIPRQGDRQ
jgi:hypothetical protein